VDPSFDAFEVRAALPTYDQKLRLGWDTRDEHTCLDYSHLFLPLSLLDGLILWPNADIVDEETEWIISDVTKFIASMPAMTAQHRCKIIGDWSPQYSTLRSGGNFTIVIFLARIPSIETGA
jgi:hypothetical protein